MGPGPAPGSSRIGSLLTTQKFTGSFRIDYWFEPAQMSPLFGNDVVSRAMAKEVPFTGKRIRGIRRWRHFQRFFTVADYRDNPKEKQKTDPLWKVRMLIDELNKQAKDMWVPGKWVTIDEQMIGFQGASSMKLRISYKREGDGFQCDAVCDRGYTYSFWFRHGPPPTLGPEFKDLELSPTARRVVWLAQRLPNKFTRIYMDNLFNSVKLYSALYRAEALAHGVARTNGRGIPMAIIQKEEKNRDRAEKLRGTTHAARLANFPGCPDVLAVSTYDTKPVHILSTVAESVEWIAKERKVWDANKKKKSLIKFLRLNVIEDYNMNMNSTDIADQLRGVYRPDHWMRHRKWWWAYFIWAIGVAGVNAYKIYDVLYDEQKKEKRPGLPSKWTHAQFLEELVYDFILPGQVRKHVDVLEDTDDASLASSIRKSRSFSLFGSQASGSTNEHDLSCATGIKEFLEKCKTHYITKDRMERNFFTRRLDGQRHAWVHALEQSHCQYCHYVWANEFDDAQKVSFKYKRQNKKKIIQCLVCNVNLCNRCDHTFHGVEMASSDV
jgi:hypothetical protein